MTRNKGYHRLKIWKESHELVLMGYKKMANFPKTELFALSSQLKRALISVPCNIVEGYARLSQKEFLRFLRIAFASLTEVEYLLELSLDLGYLGENEYNELDEQRKKTAAYLYNFIKAKRDKVTGDKER